MIVIYRSRNSNISKMSLESNHVFEFTIRLSHNSAYPVFLSFSIARL
jgi:hypothetical protein